MTNITFFCWRNTGDLRWCQITFKDKFYFYLALLYFHHLFPLITIHFLSSLLISYHHYEFRYHHYYFSLSVITVHFLLSRSFTIITIHVLSSPCISCHHSLFPIITVYFLLSPFTSCHRRSFPITTVHFLSSPSISVINFKFLLSLFISCHHCSFPVITVHFQNWLFFISCNNFLISCNHRSFLECYLFTKTVIYHNICILTVIIIFCLRNTGNVHWCQISGDHLIKVKFSFIWFYYIITIPFLSSPSISCHSRQFPVITVHLLSSQLISCHHR